MKALNLLLSSKGYPTKDKVANLIGTKIKGGAEWQITTLTGSLPLTYESRTEHILKNYALYGTASGAGVETENLFNVKQGYVYNSRDVGLTLCKLDIQPGETIYLTRTTELYTRIAYYDANNTRLTASAYVTEGYASVVVRDFSSLSYCIVEFKNPEGTILTAQQAATIAETVVSRTIPTKFVPYGYKIPLTNTGENLLDVSSEAQITVPTTTVVRWGLFIGIPKTGTYTLHYKTGNYGTYATLTYRVQHEGSWRTYHGTAYVNGVSNTNISLEQGDQICIYNGNNDQYKMATAQTDVMFTFGSTAPTAYIPYRSSTYPLYIGSTKLGEEEYLDYESGKVYKRTKQLIPRFMPQKKESEHLSIDCSGDEITVTISAGASADEALYLDVTPFDIPISVGDGGTGVFAAFVQSVGNTGTYITLRNGTTNLIDYGYLIQNTNLVKDSYTFRTQTKTCNRIYFQLSASATPTPQTLSIKLCLTDDGQTPAQYIPYYQPTDPPVPFPAITAYKGENTLSSTETVGECSVTGRIKETET